MIQTANPRSNGGINIARVYPKDGGGYTGLVEEDCEVEPVVAFGTRRGKSKILWIADNRRRAVKWLQAATVTFESS